MSVSSPRLIFVLFLLVCDWAFYAHASGDVEDKTYLPSGAFDAALGKWRSVENLNSELRKTEKVLATLGVPNLRHLKVGDQIRCTLIPTLQPLRSATLVGAKERPTAIGAIGDSAETFGNAVKHVPPRAVDKETADEIGKLINDGQCRQQPGDRTGVAPIPEGEVVVFADPVYLLVEGVESGHYFFCRLRAGLQSPSLELTPPLLAPLRRACTLLFKAAGVGT
jgi:hypothetical protein